MIFVFLFFRDFILPLFIHESSEMEEISSMPGCFRHSKESMLAEVEEAMRWVCERERESERECVCVRGEGEGGG